MCLCVCVYKCVILEISSSPKVPLLVCTKPLANGYFWDVSQKLQVRVVHEKYIPSSLGLFMIITHLGSEMRMFNPAQLGLKLSGHPLQVEIHNITQTRIINILV